MKKSIHSFPNAKCINKFLFVFIFFGLLFSVNHVNAQADVTISKRPGAVKALANQAQTPATANQSSESVAPPRVTMAQISTPEKVKAPDAEQPVITTATATTPTTREMSVSAVNKRKYESTVPSNTPLMTPAPIKSSK